MNIIKQHIAIKDIILKSILAGIMISLSCITYLNINNHIIGSIFFGSGLFFILTFQLFLFTGMIGNYKLNLNNIKVLIITLIGNYIGTFISAICFKNTQIVNNINIDNLINSINIKLNNPVLSILILSIFCGLLMNIAVKVFNSSVHILVKIIVIFLSISLFIINGFEHCIANMFYFNFVSKINTISILYIITVIMGNSIGSIAFNMYTKYNK